MFRKRESTERNLCTRVNQVSDHAECVHVAALSEYARSRIVIKTQLWFSISYLFSSHYMGFAFNFCDVFVTQTCSRWRGSAEPQLRPGIQSSHVHVYSATLLLSCVLVLYFYSDVDMCGHDVLIKIQAYMQLILYLFHLLVIINKFHKTGHRHLPQSRTD